MVAVHGNFALLFISPMRAWCIAKSDAVYVPLRAVAVCYSISVGAPHIHTSMH